MKPMPVSYALFSVASLARRIFQHGSCKSMDISEAVGGRPANDRICSVAIREIVGAANLSRTGALCTTGLLSHQATLKPSLAG